MNAPLPLSAQTVSIVAEAGPPSAAPAPYLHVAIFLPAMAGAPSRILGDETFRLVSFEGQESASELFEFELELHANTDTGYTTPYLGNSIPPAPPEIDLSIDDLVGLSITVGINCASDLSALEISQCFADAVSGVTPADDPTLAGALSAADELPGNPELAFFNGIVTAVSMAEQGVYHITMGPALAQLKHTNAYTIYSCQNIITVIQTVIDSSSSFPTPIQMQSAISGSAHASLATARVQDWLQAGESHYDFIMRLMNKANLYFYFVHSATSHTLVFADNSNLNYPTLNTAIAVFRYTDSDVTALGADQEDVIANYRYQRSLSSSSVNSSFTRQYANFEEDPPTAPSPYLASGLALPAQSVSLPLALHKNYDFGDLADEVANYTNAANAALAAASVRFSGTGFCPQFRVGYQFQLASAASQNAGPGSSDNPTLFRPSFAGGNFVLTAIKHQATADGSYQNDFQATTATGLISAFSPQQAQQETVLAIVVESAPNWESFTPNYFDPVTASFAAPPSLSYQPTGVNVIFAADPGGGTYFVKLSASMQTAPEAGAIVLVSRAQNESELPEVQNVVSSCGSVCATPSGWDANTRVGNNYSTNFGDSQNVTFGKNSSLSSGAGSAYNMAVGIVTGQYGAGYYREAGYSQGAGYSYSIAEALAQSSTMSVAGLQAELSDISGAAAGGASIVLSPASPQPDASAPSPIPVTVPLVVPPLTGLMNGALGTTGIAAPTVAPPVSAPLVAADLLLNVSESYGSTYALSQANVSSNVSSTGTAYNQSITGTSISWATTTTENTSVSNNLGPNTSVSSTTGVSTNINTNLSDSISLNTTMGDSTDVNVVQGNVKSTTVQNGSITSITTQTGGGKISNTTTQTGDIVNTTTQGGAITTTNTVGGVVTNTNSYLAAVFDTNTYLGAVTSITSQAGAVTTLNTQLGLVTSTDTKWGLVNNFTTYGGIVNDTTTALVARNVTQEGPADNILKAFVEKSENVTAATSEDSESYGEKIIIHTYGSIDHAETMGSGMISRIRPGVVENIVSGVVTQVVEMMTFL